MISQFLRRASKRLWRSAAPVWVALMLCVGCGGVSGTTTVAVGTQPTHTATSANPTPRATLTWQQGSIPPNLGFAPIIAAGDGRVAYLCATHNGQIQLWSSHDRSVTWNQITSVPTVAANAGDCTLAVDQNDAQTLVLELSGNDPTTYKTFSAGRFLSTDDGKTWQRLPDTKYDIDVFASATGRFFAIRAYDAATTSPKPDIRLSFWVSSDHMQTWQAIDQTFATQHLVVAAFWLDPQSGDLLAEVTPATISAPSGPMIPPLSPVLWETRDHGQTWQRVTTAPADQTLAVAPQLGQRWQICAATLAHHEDHTQNALSCSGDGGQTWHSRPGLNIPHQNKAGGTLYEETPLIGITADGTLLAYDFPDIYRLSPSATTWQPLSDVTASAPRGDVQFQFNYYPAGSDGLLWLQSFQDDYIASALYP